GGAVPTCPCPRSSGENVSRSTRRPLFVSLALVAALALTCCGSDQSAGEGAAAGEQEVPGDTGAGTEGAVTAQADGQVPSVEPAEPQLPVTFTGDDGVDIEDRKSTRLISSH